ncbi:DUF6790 family protein [Fluoribacter dumoffii]|uniref:DUF6790 family protein n=1 Tax=Fluoribacter dumoffii TaxID=463 RepID=UPI002ADE552B|nr:DUF6790 family protein [Fluoribacter dumoffii]
MLQQLLCLLLFYGGLLEYIIYQMIVAHNFEPGNAGSVFWTDILMPLFAFFLLWLNYRNPEKK